MYWWCGESGKVCCIHCDVVDVYIHCDIVVVSVHRINHVDAIVAYVRRGHCGHCGLHVRLRVVMVVSRGRERVIKAVARRLAIVLIQGYCDYVTM
jgi:hypothetical protein